MGIPVGIFLIQISVFICENLIDINIEDVFSVRQAIVRQDANTL